jgi:hypothetical protein
MRRSSTQFVKERDRVELSANDAWLAAARVRARRETSPRQPEDRYSPRTPLDQRGRFKAILGARPENVVHPPKRPSGFRGKRGKKNGLHTSSGFWQTSEPFLTHFADLPVLRAWRPAVC